MDFLIVALWVIVALFGVGEIALALERRRLKRWLEEDGGGNS